MSELLHYLKSTSEIRSLSSPLEKCLWLHQNHQISLRVLAEEFEISKSSLSRAKIAIQEQRTPGMEGRPKSLTDEEEAQLKQFVREYKDKNGEDISNVELIRKVN